MINNITFQQVEAFLTVARYQSITKASEILYMSQPALSKILKRFEDNFGLALFTRTNHGMALTSAGKLLYAKLSPLYGDLDVVFHSILDQIGPEDRFLHIGIPVTYDFSSEFDPVKKAISDFHAAYPEIKINESIFDLHKLQNALDVGWVDLVIAPEWSIDRNKQICQKTICELRQAVTISAAHPLAQSDDLDFNLLSECNFLAVPYQDILYSKELLAMLCRKNGITPRSIDCPPNFATALHSAILGNTVTVAWPVNVGSAQTGLKFYPLPNTQMPLHAVVAWSPDRLTRASRLFLSAL